MNAVLASVAMLVLALAVIFATVVQWERIARIEAYMGIADPEQPRWRRVIIGPDHLPITPPDSAVPDTESDDEHVRVDGQ